MTAQTDTRCTVQLHPLGFIVTHEGHLMPKALPGRVLIFSQRFRAQQLADAIDANDMTAAHEAVGFGQWYQVAA